MDLVVLFLKLQGLRHNALPHSFDSVQYMSGKNLNEDSSNRKRSSSLTEQVSESIVPPYLHAYWLAAIPST